MPIISDFVTINLQSFLETLLPIAIVRINPSHLDLWVGAKITELLCGIFKFLLIIFFSLKNIFITISWVINIAIRPKKGFISWQILIVLFFKFNLLYINKLYVCNFLLARIGRLLNCLKKRVINLWQH